MRSEPVNFWRAFSGTWRYKACVHKSAEARVRLRKPDRRQVLMRMECDDDLIPQGHQARTTWAVVGKPDLSAFSEPIKARDGVCGRDATDPALLVSPWLYAATRGVGSARELARQCAESKPYRWLCGGASINYHTLSDFRVGHAKAPDELFTPVLASLVDQGLVKVRRIGRDGTRVRACAGAASFRGEERLNRLMEVERRTGHKVREHLVDGGFLVPDEIDAAAEAGVTLFVPPTVPRDPDKLDERWQPKSTDTDGRAAWRQRMGTGAAKEVCRERAPTAETVNADLKTHRGLGRLLVRGTGKIKCVALRSALAYNLLHFGGSLTA